MKTIYSIISRGTEKYINHGYMCITESKNNKQYILAQDHCKDCELDNTSLSFPDGKYSLSNIAISRFQLISEIGLKKQKIDDNILILGFGSVALGCLIYLLENNYKKISIFARTIPHNIKKLEKYFGVKIAFVNSISDKYNTYIETTGDSLVFKKLIDNIGNNKRIIIESTLRDNKYSVNPLDICRKNLIIIGVHELNGINLVERNKLFNKTLEKNKNIEYILEDYISIKKYSETNVKKLREKKCNFVDILKNN